MKQQLYTLDYKQSRFQFPNFTKNAKSDTDTVRFFNCDFSAVQNINLSGFKSVIFIGYDTIFRPQSKIEITNCKSIRFEKVTFQNEQSTLNITSAEFVTFDNVHSTYQMKLKTHKCGTVTYNDSELNFDTSNMHTRKFEICASQIARIKTLDLTGITEELQIRCSNVFDLKEMNIKKGLKKYIDYMYGAREILEPITQEH